MKKVYLWLSIITLLSFTLVGSLVYYYVFKPNVNDTYNREYLDIPSDSSFDRVLQIMQNDSVLIDDFTFRAVAYSMNYQKDKVPSGRYKIDNKWNNREIIRILRSGRQTPVKITFNQCRTIYNLANRITSSIELDSATYIDHLLKEATLLELGFNKENIMTMFMANTYEVYWDISAKELTQKMFNEYKRFWSRPDRQEKLKELNLNEKELYTLASIVEKETLAPSERKKVAGLYINRLRKGMRLEADPTVVFATGLYDLRRVRYKHLEIDSPYNTYKNDGLPPGPIFMPDISTIDATLNYVKHDFIFFCARPDNSGLHAFAKNNAGHAANARKYHQYLNSRKIR